MFALQIVFKEKRVAQTHTSHIKTMCTYVRVYKIEKFVEIGNIKCI